MRALAHQLLATLHVYESLKLHEHDILQPVNSNDTTQTAVVYLKNFDELSTKFEYPSQKEHFLKHLKNICKTTRTLVIFGTAIPRTLEPTDCDKAVVLPEYLDLMYMKPLMTLFLEKLQRRSEKKFTLAKDIDYSKILKTQHLDRVPGRRHSNLVLKKALSTLLRELTIKNNTSALNNPFIIRQEDLASLVEPFSKFIS